MLVRASSGKSRNRALQSMRCFVTSPPSHRRRKLRRKQQQILLAADPRLAEDAVEMGSHGCSSDPKFARGFGEVASGEQTGQDPRLRGSQFVSGCQQLSIVTSIVLAADEYGGNSSPLETVA